MTAIYNNHSKNSPSKSYLNFGAISRAQYKSNNDYVKIYEIEESDLPYFKDAASKMDKYVKEHNMDESPNQILKQSILATDTLLSTPKTKTNKTKIFLAESNSRPLGILIANVPKKTKDNFITYSSRKNQGKRETEIDWLVTWNEKNKPHVKGVGKMLVNELFNTLEKDGFSQVYVRSEIPENSYAVNFYTRMGFEPLINKKTSLEKATTNKYLFESNEITTDKILPMIAKPNDIKKKNKEIYTKYHRHELPNVSVDLYNIIK